MRECAPTKPSEPSRRELPPSRSAQRPKFHLGIATIFFPPIQTHVRGKLRCPRSSAALPCGLLPWCASVRRLRDALPADVVASTLAIDATIMARRQRAASCRTEPWDPQDCPELRWLSPSPALLDAASGHLRRRLDACVRRQPSCATHWLASSRFSKVIIRLGGTLLKWELMRLVEYDAILFSDMDVDLMPTRLLPVGRGATALAPIREEWARMLPILMAPDASIRMVASADWSSPINAGLLLLRPSAAIFREGLDALHAPFDTSRGWNRTGGPAALMGAAGLLHTDGSTLHYQGAPARIDHQNWDFVGSDIDQGLFFYVLLARHRVGRYARLRHGGRASPGGSKRAHGQQHMVDHYWGTGQKPWQHVLSEWATQASTGASGAKEEVAGAAVDDASTREAARSKVATKTLCWYARWVREGALARRTPGLTPPFASPCMRRYMEASQTLGAELCKREANCTSVDEAEPATLQHSGFPFRVSPLPVW
jgi:hypothetical protein